MKIGIDIDNTIAPTFKTIVNFMTKKHGLKKDINKSKKPTGYDLFHSNFDDFYFEWKEFVNSKDHDFMKPIKGSIKIIEKLSKKYQLYILTAREENQKIKTILWIDKHYKNKFEEYLFLKYKNNKDADFTKGDLCKQFDLDIMIEDDVHYAKDILEKSKKTIILLFNKKNTYNWSKTKIKSKKIIKVTNWKSIEKEIKKIDLKKSIQQK